MCTYFCGIHILAENSTEPIAPIYEYANMFENEGL